MGLYERMAEMAEAAEDLFMYFEDEADVSKIEDVVHREISWRAGCAVEVEDADVAVLLQRGSKAPHEASAALLRLLSLADDLFGNLDIDQSRRIEAAVQREIMYRAAIVQSKCVMPPCGWDMFGR